MSNTDILERAKRAAVSARRFIDQHFNNPDTERPTVRIPADEERDDDIVLLDYIKDSVDAIQQLRAELQELVPQFQEAQYEAVRFNVPWWEGWLHGRLRECAGAPEMFRAMAEKVKRDACAFAERMSGRSAADLLAATASIDYYGRTGASILTRGT